jgi:hypothetical protein
MAANDPAGPNAVPTHFVLIDGEWHKPPGAPRGLYCINMGDGRVENFISSAELRAARAARKPRTFSEVVE